MKKNPFLLNDLHKDMEGVCDCPVCCPAKYLASIGKIEIGSVKCSITDRACVYNEELGWFVLKEEVIIE